jgi:hypothetical protein
VCVDLLVTARGVICCTGSGGFRQRVYDTAMLNANTSIFVFSAKYVMELIISSNNSRTGGGVRPAV